MKHFRASDARGKADFGWLDSRHSFSFGRYYDPGYMGFGPLRVINEDKVAPGRGFDTHPHDNMEIISYVIEGGLEHRDSMGEVSVIRPGDVQRMSAGSGVTHSEYNASKTEPVHFLQIWIVPEKQDLQPSYEQRHFDDMDGKLRLVGSRDGRNGSITIHQDVDLYIAKPAADQTLSLRERDNRALWLQVIKGQLTAAGQALAAGDGMAFAETADLDITARETSEFLLFDMAL